MSRLYLPSGYSNHPRLIPFMTAVQVKAPLESQKGTVIRKYLEIEVGFTYQRSL